ncbi:MAG: hypothetical protein HOK67_13615 [Deltaproteobacteria bacterium]|jgi:phosphomannomutase|nr:hypothetical protein [Deltaproteobacteria bacterium]MBT4266225.1 hypothetical protein [Deltaproteobacteria bacterium]MBT4637384.1 hypothetical protein [Deltaproteobacteria bacterium]MBT6500931.1 hypothetical protein [Deltaproteobacteria bacterium]MBT6614476.1 hypothetical protein [Deltaproteobacteria bacterium]
MEPVTRLQGTDGIRGRISNEQPRNHGMNALTYFHETGFLTPAFFEHYTYAYASLLLEAGSVKKGESIVIGWDPRDQVGDFNKAAILGICKAGMRAIIVGVLPTPAVPLYMLSQHAAGCVVLTASHNPSDQNGIKLFHGWTALKFLPEDDAALTLKIIEQQNVDLDNLPVSEDFEDHIDAAKSFFIQYQIDPLNSWIDQQTFTDVVLVIDASKGAVATVVSEIFGRYRFQEVIYTNLEGGINEYCGVADLEGQELIYASEITEQSGRFFLYETLQTMIGKARSMVDIQAGKTQMIGLVFDGDGDRCFRLDYHADKDALIVSSGDQLGIHLARYIKQRDGSKTENSWFINTVESDLKTAITAEEEGYQSVITGVGDKWILKKAVLDMIQAQLDTEHPMSGALKTLLQADASGEELSGLEISFAWKAYLQRGRAEDRQPQYRYQIGIEESGHSILPGFIKDGSATIRCFAGNGIKSGLNSLLAIQQTVLERNGKDRISYLEHPFSAGIKTTFYTYYVIKKRLLPGSAFRQDLERAVRQAVDTCFSADYQSNRIHFPEEESLIYFKISKSGKTAGAVFIRNSGTEDKSALYLRGELEIAPFLKTIGQILHLFLLKGMKNQKSDFVRFEIDALKMIAGGLSTIPLREKYPSLPYERILKEIEFKEGLLGREEKDLMLTEKGKLLNDYWEQQD